MTVTDQVKQLTGADIPRWDAFVQSCAEATFFQRSGWRDVVETGVGHRTHFIYVDRGGEIAGVMPIVEVKSRLFGHSLVSTGFGVGGGAIAVDETARSVLHARAAEILAETRANYLEVRAPAKLQDGWVTRDNLYADYACPLPADEAENLKQIPRKQRAVVRKAIDSALTWRIDSTADDFYRLYATSVRNLGTPVFPKSLFVSFLKAFPQECEIVTVLSEGRPVAGVMAFYFRDRVMPFYAGSVPEARRLGANDLMYWRLMRRAAERGCTIFNFGRSKVGSGHADFKKNWGFEPTPIAHQFLLRPGAEMPNLNPNNPKYKLLIAAWKRLPLPISMILGPLLARDLA